MPKLEDLELKIKQTTANTQGIKGMANALSDLARATSSLGNVGDSIKKMNDALHHFPTQSGTAVKDFATAFVKLKNTSQYASAIGSSIRQVTRALNDMINAINVDKLTAIADAMNKIQDASKFARVSTAVKAATKSAEGSTAKGDTESASGVADGMAEVTEATNEATQSVYTFRDALRDIGKGAKSGLSAVGNALKKVGSAALTAGKNLVGMGWERLKSKVQGVIGPIRNLVSSFGRIAMYRALRTAIKAITTGFSEGIKHVYQWAQLVGDKFTNTMDSMATSAHYLRDSLGAMASPLLDALAPAIDALVEKFVNLLNAVNQFIAAFTGQSTWRKAVKTPTQYSGAMKEATEQTKKATKAQKELNKALQGFDELNLITTSEINARKPTSGGGSDGAEVSSSEFVTVPVADWIQQIKDAIESGDWAGAGTLLAEKLNGMVKEWKAKEFGNKIGEKFQKGLDFYLAFMKKFEWEDLGTKIGQMFNGIFEKMSAEDLGHALVAHIKAGVSLAKGFLKEAKPTFEALGVAVSTAINDFFDPDFAVEFGETIAAGVNDAIAFLKTAIVGTEKVIQNYDTGETFTIKVGGIDFKQVGESLMTSIFTAIGEINWADLGETAAGIFTGIIDAIRSGVEYAAKNIGQIATAIKDFAFAFFGGIWEWFWPAAFQFLTGGEGYTYHGGDGNDRPNSPVTTGQGATTMEGFNQEVTEATDWLTESWKWLEEHNPLNLDVTDTGNTINTQSSNVQGLNDELDHTDGTFTSEFKTKELQNRLKAVNPYAQLIDDIDGKQTSTFATSKLDEKKNAVTPYSNMIAAIGKKITTTFAVSNYKDTYDKVKALNDQLAATGKAWKITVTADLRLKPHSGSYYTIEPMAEGGFPTQGSLFVAGEVPNSTEMVGNINGKTGVASGKEITGISEAVYNTGETEAELLREQNRLLRQLLAKGNSVTLAPNAAAGRWIAQSQQAYARATGG